MTIYAYARNVSVHAGEDLELCVSTDAPYFSRPVFTPR